MAYQMPVYRAGYFIIYRGGFLDIVMPYYFYPGIRGLLDFFGDRFLQAASISTYEGRVFQMLCILSFIEKTLSSFFKLAVRAGDNVTAGYFSDFTGIFYSSVHCRPDIGNHSAEYY